MRVYHKAYVYLTCGSRLLVFSQPDEPHIGLQVPGGTLDPGESYLQGARREFHEETGLMPEWAFDHLADQDQIFHREDGSLHGLHRRRHFHARIATPPREDWEHYEMTPSSGGAPIRFRLFWLDLFGPTAHDAGAFFQGFHVPLDTLRARIGELAA
ncbi:NUDIX hydrolase [Polymorphum gilvum]|uniref:Hydrolase, NUDIX family, putative n=1 Tax=Polymorphum gilvum (strain LMG 25793 / CGMCC 1.9160 / SL003B-26A1) TaxID=991905 RepID=F2J249_POLGS|nr:NUDIX domain-containing protein [Polymorphum gilvum]ADZ68807.1 Hydrolase, NUDIX family, putative [Polymorphum gilvum SL003B-26A1]